MSTAARLVTNIAYQNKDMLSAGMIVAGWDKHNGGTLYGIPLGGTMLQLPYALGGSGSSYISGFVDKVCGWALSTCICWVSGRERLGRKLLEEHRWSLEVTVCVWCCGQGGRGLRGRKEDEPGKGQTKRG